MAGDLQRHAPPFHFLHGPQPGRADARPRARHRARVRAPTEAQRRPRRALHLDRALLGAHPATPLRAHGAPHVRVPREGDDARLGDTDDGRAWRVHRGRDGAAAVEAAVCGRWRADKAVLRAAGFRVLGKSCMF